MSEEEILEDIKSLSPSENAIQGLLDLYNKEKEKNKKAKRYILEKQSIQYKYALSQIECEELLNILEE